MTAWVSGGVALAGTLASVSANRTAASRAKDAAAQSRADNAAAVYGTQYGDATATGYTAKPQSAGQQAILGGAEQGLQGVVGGGLGASPERLQAFQDAFIAERQPNLDRSLQQQADAQKLGSATRGTAGSSTDLYQQALMNQFANDQRGQLLNQAIQGREGLAATALNQGVAQGNFYQGLGQQDFNNQLASQQAASNARLGVQSGNIASSNAAGLAAANASAQSRQNLYDAVGGAKAGYNLYQGISGKKAGDGGGTNAFDTTLTPSPEFDF